MQIRSGQMMSATASEDLPAEQELAHILITELLAHQFCFPVQWIKTQDVILRDFKAQRLVEVGPADILTNMAKKSLDSISYKVHDTTRGLQREVLNAEKNEGEVYYIYSPEVEDDEPQPATPAPIINSRQHPQDDLTTSPAPSMSPKKYIPQDQPIGPLDILIVITALALKKDPAGIPKDQSIRALCGGRSTVQNEIIGDLTKELGSLPDQAEEVALADLSQTLADSHMGNKFGPLISSLISRLLSSKMPPGRNTSSLRQHLQDRWSLGPGLQDRALLLAVARPPNSRLGSDKEIEKFLCSIAKDTMKAVGLDPDEFQSSKSSAQRASPGNLVGIPESFLRDLEAQQQKKDTKLLETYAKLSGHDLDGVESSKRQLYTIIQALQAKIDAWSSEHGETYQKSIEPKFRPSHARVYDSFWNWNIQDLFMVFHKGLRRDLKEEDCLTQSISHFANRVTPRFLEVITHLLGILNNLQDSPEVDSTRYWLLDLERHSTMALAEVKQPLFRYSFTPTIPILHIDERGRVDVLERSRPVLASSTESWTNASNKTFNSSELENSSGGVSREVTSRENTPSTDIPTNITSLDLDPHSASQYSDANSFRWTPVIKTKALNAIQWVRNFDVTNAYLHWFEKASRDGFSLQDQAILITGAGRGSIGSEIVSLSLAAGAKVLATTSSYSKEAIDFYQASYRRHGGHGSQLVVVPFNGASHQDISNLVKFIYEDSATGGLGWDLDHVIPFAALPEGGRGVDSIDDKSEVAHRAMLTNVLRLLGAIKVQKQERRFNSHPTNILLPLSPNHGSFGQDGLYSESKVGLEVLLSKWWTEDWSDYLTLCGVVIGWTRGTGLMGHNDILAAGLEDEIGIQTFSSREMAWHIMGLIDAGLASLCDFQPLKVDLTGGLTSAVSLKAVCDRIKQNVQTRSSIKKALFEERCLESAEADLIHQPTIPIKARIEIDEMSGPADDEVQPLADQLAGMVDLDRVVVAVGFGEAGPCGSSRTRWEAECSGTFSVNGCVELAWMMGLVKYHNGMVKGKDYCGWLDVETQQPIGDAEIKTRYEEYIISHTGIRIVERRQRDISEPDEKKALHEVAITENVGPFDVSPETASDLVKEHGEYVAIRDCTDGQVSATIKAGATIFIQKAAQVSNTIGAQLPTGWDARTYGIPEDVISQVDPITLYAIVATVEALISAGITDPYELYDFIGVADVGNAIGSGHGGQASLQAMFKQRFLDQPVQKDVLTETFVNTTAAWINMLLCGSSGPIRTPVGACATSLESIDTGVDLIRNGKAKAVLVGGADTLERESAQEFGNLHATVDASNDSALGRTPKEASRPTTTTRAGFVEGEGCGIQLLTTARLALDMGLPVHAVVALTHTASDQISRSVPAPGKGLLTIAAEQPAKYPSPLLKMPYRRRQIECSRRQIEEKCKLEREWMINNHFQGDPDGHGHEGSSEQQRLFLKGVTDDAARAYRDAQNTYGNDFWRDDPSISPLRGALAAWGLTVDDLSVASLHGTSTVQNDLNETDVIQRQLEQLGRKKGDVLPCVAQKSIVGHGKGAAGAFAMNGCLQMLRYGIIPGNRNADNIDPKLQLRDLLFFPSETYHSSTPMKAFSVTSFGFGQKGAQVVGVHSRYLFATIPESEFHSYKEKAHRRKIRATAALQEGIYGGSLVRIKAKSVYKDEDLENHLLSRM